MSYRPLAPRLPACAIAAALVLVVTAGTAHARANVGTFFSQQTEVNQAGTPECISGDFSGTETLTFTDSGRFVETGTGFHFEATETLAVNTVFTNGFYIVGSASNHFAFNATLTSGQTVFTFAGHEVHTIYDAEGVAVAQVIFAGVSHITYRDLNGNGQPDDGEVTATFEHFHFTCV
jgi:hypothetical protein